MWYEMFLGKFLHEFCLVLGFSRFQPQCFYNVYKKGSYKKEKKKGFHNYRQRAPRRLWRNIEEVRRRSPLPSTPSILTAMLHGVACQKCVGHMALKLRCSSNFVETLDLNKLFFSCYAFSTKLFTFSSLLPQC